ARQDRVRGRLGRGTQQQRTRPQILSRALSGRRARHIDGTRRLSAPFRSVSPMATTARKIVATALSVDELAELDRACERQDVSRAEAMRTAIRWYIGAAGSLPPADAATPEEIAAIERGEAEFARGECRALEHVQRELGLPTC